MSAPGSGPRVAEGSIPQFGRHDPAVEYVLRPGGYCVIRDDAGNVALVETNGHHYLPGGGMEPGESAEEAAVREAAEECGLVVFLLGGLGTADELIHVAREGAHYRKRCAFFRAEVRGASPAGAEPGHRLVWAAPDRALALLRDDSQQWAVRRAIDGGS